MSSLRPGTVDYSKWDNLSISSDGSTNSVDKDDNEQIHKEEDNDIDVEEDDDDEEEESEDEIVSESPVRGNFQRPVPSTPNTRSSSATTITPQVRAPPPLAALQTAWNTKSTGEDDDENVQGREEKKQKVESKLGLSNLCAACGAPNPKYRCSRCELVKFCDQDCQIRYHPIHKTECIDSRKHMAYWGFLNTNKDDKSSSEKKDSDGSNKHQSKEAKRAALQKALEARLLVRRRRLLKLAAAAAAVERARVARNARAGGGKKGKGAAEEKEELCSVCQCEFTVSGDSGVGLCCPASHHMCAECAGVYVSSVVGDLETSYPPRCPLCRADLPLDHFEVQLTTQQQSILKAFTAQRALQPGQVLVKCPECEFFEVQPAPGSVIWWCRACDFGTCFVCNKSLPPNVYKYDIAKSPHAVCKALRFAKTKIEQAIEAGSKMQCPKCGLAGRKDDACTHMTCAKCATVWCYVCGLDVKACDKAPPRPGSIRVDDIFLHNQNWQVNEKRCPMYLTQILEVDLHWLGDNWEERATDEDFEDDEKCLDYFHRFQTIKKLQEVREEIGYEDFQAVFEHFDSIKNSGYTLEEVIATDTGTLIDREDYLQHHVEEEHDDGDENSDGGDGNEDGETDSWEAVPEGMTRAVLTEEEQIRNAIDASRMSAQEDELVRRAMEESSGNGN